MSSNLRGSLGHATCDASFTAYLAERSPLITTNGRGQLCGMQGRLGRARMGSLLPAAAARLHGYQLPINLKIRPLAQVSGRYSPGVELVRSWGSRLGSPPQTPLGICVQLKKRKISQKWNFKGISIWASPRKSLLRIYDDDS